MVLLTSFELLFIASLTIYFFVRGGIISDKLLALFYFILSINFVSTLCTVTGLYEKFPQFLFLDMGIPIILGPLFWFYVNSLTRSKTQFDSNYWFHFLPVIFYYVMFLDLILLPGEEKFIISESTVTSMTIRWKIASIFQLIPVPVYLLVSLNELKRYNKKIKHLYSDISNINLAWLRFLLLAFGLLWIMVSISIFLVNFNESMVPAGILIFNSAFFIFGISAGIYAIRRNIVISEIDIDIKPNVQQRRQDKNKDDLINLIKNKVEEEMIFTDPGLTLTDMANSLDIAPYLLSRLLNENYGLNFFDFINRHRIDYFKERILAGDHNQYTIISIAYDSGFNSKSAFYRAFKSYTGTTPNIYISRLMPKE